ncbi:thioesterase [Marinicauda salina]|uniref:Thioesterase n=1 Tax=Marinicauda salina TaxID=2135793 RepID=A0A2U2BX30_9PROT|nr:thioesterase family protein [Marinicauda salina]PWE18576.1 thioesterase [Marinicauda salina]
MKPDPARLKRETYPVVITVPTRFQDLDPLGHINNVAIGAFYEEARGALNRAVFPKGSRHELGVRILIADVHIVYLGEAFHPRELEVGAGIERIGTSSYTIASGLFQDGACIGTSETVIVNTAEGRSAPLPDKAKALLEEYRLKTG